MEARGRLARLLDALSIPPGYAVAIRDLAPHAHRATLAELWDRDLVPVILDPHLPGALRDDLLAELRPAAVVRWTAGEGAGAGGPGTDPGTVPPAAVHPCAEQPVSRDKWRRFDAPDPDGRPGTPDSGDAVAYVAYTSGSTGRPKGAVIGRRAFDSFVASTCELYGLGPKDRRLLLSNPAFDLAMEQVGTSLHAGCALVPAGDGLVATDPASLAAEVTRHGITVLSLPTGVFNAVGAAMAADGAAAAAFRDAPVRLVMAGGEAPDRAAIRGWARALPGARLLNGYGPTECTVVTSYGEMTPDGPVTVGRPLPGVTYELRDGELIIGGVQVGRGYVHGAAGGFEPGGDRRYATGDGARMLPDGRWVIEGRRDRMVKVSGYRVDPAVVEEVVASADGVAAAHAVMADGTLGCLLVLDAEAAGDERGAAVMGRVRDRCRAALPPYAVPRLLAVADAIPLTGRGKRDAAASAEILRAGAGADPAADASATPGPDGGIDGAVRAVWARHVGDPDDGRSFVDAGADSLTAVAVRGALLRELGADVPLPAIVAGSVGDLVDAVHRSRAGVAPGHVSSGRVVVRLRGAVASARDVAEPSADTGVRWVFLPPMSGAVTRYLRLSRLLPAEHEVLACETARKDLEGGFGTVVTAMADGICAVVPAGADVRVSGFSLGGVYARAVAVELAARGYARCSAHLIDPPDPGGHVTPERAAFLVFAQVGLAIPGDGARFLHGAVARGEVDEVRDSDVDWGRLAQAAVASGMAAPGDSPDVLRDAWEVYRLNAGILAGFDAARYSGAEPPTRILVGADGEDIGYDGAVAERAAGGDVPVERIAPSGAWARLCPAATFDRLAVDHFALLDPPHDAAVARWLAGAPGAAEPRDGRP